MKQEIIISIVTIVIILLVYYIVYSERKSEEKRRQKMQDELKIGDKIVTYSGLTGVVKEISDDRLIISCYPNDVELSVEKWAIAGLDDRTIENNKNNKKTEDKKAK